MLTWTIFIQYSYYNFWVNRTQFSRKDLIVMPVFLATLAGSVFGVWEIFANKQMVMRPKRIKVDPKP